MNNDTAKLSFASDYQEGAHPAILQRLVETNLEKTPGYGEDEYSESARRRIRAACAAPEADVYFLVGGTQANATVIDALLRPYQGAIAAESGHINVHESGAIELGGHKVLSLAQENGKLTAQAVERCAQGYWQDDNREHMVMPGLVYLSQPTEYGTLYSLSELEAIRAVCDRYSLSLYLDGARLAYALSCPENDVTLKSLARLCDAFYIGGTKCGALFGEAVVFPQHDRVPHFFTIVKQHGALLAKGRIAGLQFDTLFTDGLYERLGRHAVAAADRLRAALRENGYELAFPAPTNQIFLVLDEAQREALSRRVEMSFWEKRADGRTVVRLATSWATAPEDVDALITLL
ncbi:MAG: low specificity L-threonine aldolase [Oscillospiraceae bacterium]|nr:low specificity L-threonine aldolase [Oscillospiraceae bacterium]